MNRSFFILVLSFICLLLFGYWNHFDNGFEFDDIHTIVDNSYIQDIRNIPEFFTNTETFGTNPANRGYRPVVTTLNAIDYWLGGGLHPRYFHISYFLNYIIQLIVLFYFIRNFISNHAETKLVPFIALFAVSFYGLHTANAETINYIIARSDQFSTLCILLGLLIFQSNNGRKFFLYLLPVIVGLATKEVTAVFPLLLLFYILIFQHDKINFTSIKKSFITSLPVFILVPLIFLFFSSFNEASTAGDAIAINERLRYLFTQSIVITHYIGNYILPIELSVDPDFQTITNYFDHQVIFSTLFLMGLIFVGIIACGKKALKPIGFGILWFFICLGPTSSLHPFGQIANDHRTFLPYIGLVISTSWAIYLLYIKYVSQASIKIKSVAFSLISLVLIGHSIGVRERSNLWSSSLLLWEDGVNKSPNNARAHLNYGLALMENGDLENAMIEFKESEKIWPNWSVTKINLGILHAALNDLEQAETYFKMAIQTTPYYPDAYYFYARFLDRQGRPNEAIRLLQIGKSHSPAHAKINHLLNSLLINDNITSIKELSKLEKEAISTSNVNDLINLSLRRYQNSQYEQCIELCQEVLRVDPNSSIAYNNICSAYNQLKKWEKAKAACEKAIEIDPNFQLAKNNLNISLKELQK